MLLKFPRYSGSLGRRVHRHHRRVHCGCLGRRVARSHWRVHHQNRGGCCNRGGCWCLQWGVLVCPWGQRGHLGRRGHSRGWDRRMVSHVKAWHWHCQWQWHCRIHCPNPLQSHHPMVTIVIVGLLIRRRVSERLTGHSLLVLLHISTPVSSCACSWRPCRHV